MHQYLGLLERVLREGVPTTDRTGVGTVATFGHQLQFDLYYGFPLLTTKKLHIKSIIHELLWFLSGSTNIKYLNDNGVSIWDAWADKNGELGPIYSVQWRRWSTPKGEIDQIQRLVDTIKTEPHSRRQLVSAWNVADIPNMALPPCHVLFQTAVLNGELHLHVYQRSADVFLGVPFNIASYALLLSMLAQQCDLTPRMLVWSAGDVHIYSNHVTQAKQQLTRAPHPLPRLSIKRRPESIFDYAADDFEISNYIAHPHIKAPVAV